MPNTIKKTRLLLVRMWLSIPTLGNNIFIRCK